MDFNVKLADAPAMKMHKKLTMENIEKFKYNLIVEDSNFSIPSNDINITASLKEATGADVVLVASRISILRKNIGE